MTFTQYTYYEDRPFFAILNQTHRPPQAPRHTNIDWANTLGLITDQERHAITGLYALAITADKRKPSDTPCI